MDGSFNNEVIIVDTPGLSDTGHEDIFNLMSMSSYHNASYDTGDTKPSVFLFLLKDGRFNGPLVDMLKDLSRALGPGFWKHVAFGFVRMPFTADNVEEYWPNEDFSAVEKGRQEIYGENLVAHRKNWGARIDSEARSESYLACFGGRQV